MMHCVSRGMSRSTALAVSLMVLLPALASGDERPASEDTPKSVAEVADHLREKVVVITFEDRDGGQGGLGTGFIISPDGIIATNLHVIGEARPISVQLSDGRQFEVQEVRASDRKLDLALLRIDANDLPAVELGDATQLRPGQQVVAVGNPHGLKHSVVDGVVSELRQLDGRNMIQVAIPIEPGNSGGPLVDMQGFVHGILTIKSAVTPNLGFAVTVNDLKRLIEQPNPVPMERWLRIGTIDDRRWDTLFGSRWRQRAGRIMVTGPGRGFGGRALCLSKDTLPDFPCVLSVAVKLEDESGAAGLVFHSDGDNKHYGFYPSNGRLRLTRFDGPNVFTWNVLAESNSEHYRPGEWNHLKVRLQGDGGLACFVNGKPVFDMQDAVYTSGRFGLAKFRHTEAEFKHLRAIRQSDVPEADPETLAAIESLVAEIETADLNTSDHVQALAGFGDVSPSVLLEDARQLERRAVGLRELAEQVHVKQVVTQLGQMTQGEDEDIDLARAALWIARLDDDQLVVDDYMDELDRMASELADSIPEEADDNARLAAINRYLFDDNGFHGSRMDYYHPANSYLNRLLEDREGIPITLSLLYVELAQRINLTLVGVGIPGHFVVGKPQDDELQLIDAFNGGELLTPDDAERLAGQKLSDEYFVASSKRHILVRMLRNLLSIAQHERDPHASLRYLEAMLAIDSEMIRERGLRAVTLAQTGNLRDALKDLDWILEQSPEGVDVGALRRMRERFAEQLR